MSVPGAATALLAVVLALPVVAAPPSAPETTAWGAAARVASVEAAAESIRYYLRRYGAAPELAARLEKIRASDPGGNPTVSETVAAAARALGAGLKNPDVAALEDARRRTERYYGDGAVRLFSPDDRGAESAPLPGWPAAVAAVRAADLPMEDASGYAASRLGALGALAARAAKDGLAVSVAPADGSWPPGCAPRAPRRLNLPGAVHGFRARAALCAGGGVALTLDRFAGSSLYRHEAALLRHALARASRAPRVFHAAGAATTRDDGLLAAFAPESGLPRVFDALALGYYDELKAEFAPETEASGPGWRGFSVRVGTTVLVALESDETWYGEILGAALKRLRASGVEFGSVYFAGSAGALNYRPPYSLAHPTCYRADDGRVDLPNELSSDARGDCHSSIASPLLETRAWLAAAAARAETVDVEGFSLARAASEAGLRLGSAYLITDYPEAPKPVRGYRLSRWRHEERLAGAKEYARRLRARLESGRRTFRTELETALQESLTAASAAASVKARAELGELSEAEAALYARVASSPPPVIFRTKPARLARVREDGLALSPRQVDLLKGGQSAASSLAPAGEDALYGARDFLFAGVGQNDAEELYGPIRAHLSHAAWRRGFATRTSGARVLAQAGLDPKAVPDAESLAKARRAFVTDASLPHDWPARLAALAVLGYRELARAKGSEEAARRLAAALAADSDGLWRRLDEDTDAYLEVKIPWGFPARALGCVEETAAQRGTCRLAP